MEFQTLCLNPLVVVADNVFNQTIAEQIIANGSPKLQRAAVVSDKGDRVDDSRTNSAAYLSQVEDRVLWDFATLLGSIVRLPVENAEPCQLLHYTGPQEFRPHSDGFDTGGPKGAEHLSRGGQRLFTTICYLNNVEAGGETEFPDLKIRVAPKLGRVLVFGNTVLGSNDRHPHSLHAGVAVTAGEKWALTFWWRERPYTVPRDYPAAVGEFLAV